MTWKTSLLAAALCLVLGPASRALAQIPSVGPSAETLYADASAKESAVRRALAATNPPVTVLRAVRTVVLDYETIVRLYPTSGYCDDALWRAALLSNDAFRTFGDGRERTAAMRLLRSLSSQYPSSKFAKQGPPLVAELSTLPVKTTTAGDAPDAPDSSAAATLTTGTTAVKPAAIEVTDRGSVPVATASSAPPATAVRPTVMAAAAPATSDAVPAAARSVAAKPPSARPSSKLALIQDIRRVVLSDVVRIVIELDREVTFHDERLDKPTRVFVDLAATETVAKLRDQTIRFDSDADLVRQVRIGRHPNSTTRVVLDAADISSYSVYPLYNPFRLVIDCVRTQPASDVVVPAMFPSPPAPPAASVAPLRTPERQAALPPFPQPRATVLALLVPRRMTSWGTMPIGAGSSELAIRESQTVPLLDTKPVRHVIEVPEAKSSRTSLAALLETAPVPVVTMPEEPLPSTIAPPARNLDGSFSLARQLGMSVSRIVIDPGHGGHDPGTKSTGTNEAEVVLDVALRLETLLRSNPGIDVVLTRRTNAYVSLQERTAIANREAADLFLSIHANASNVASAHGVETYFLNFASNLSAAAVAARENAASGQSMNALPDVVKSIALNNKLDESKDFATHVQRELVAKLRPTNKALRDLGVKQAPFQVLIGAAMPSVLAEISFLTNAQESRLLRQTSYRQKIAEALYSAIRKYQASLNVSTIAKQPS